MISNVKVELEDRQRTNKHQPSPITCHILVNKQYKQENQSEIILIEDFPTIITIHHDSCQMETNINSSCNTFTIHVDKCYAKDAQQFKLNEELLVEEFLVQRSTFSSYPFLAWDMQLCAYHRNDVAAYSFVPSVNSSHVVIPKSFRQNNNILYTGLLGSLMSMWIAFYFLFFRSKVNS